MFDSFRIIAIIPAYNEAPKIGRVVSRIPRDVVDTALVVDDGSTDATPDVARCEGANVLSLNRVSGVGYAIRSGLDYAQRNHFHIAVILAGNNKDSPEEIPRLLEPICRESADLVVGSRYLAGGVYGGDMPLYRRIATRIHPRLMSLFCGKRLTESTNGFRAIRLSCLDDERIRLNQKWLDGYGLEVYLLHKLIALGFRHVEVPCSKLYPSRKIGYTKMNPVIGWWDILRPVLLLGLGLRR